MTWPANHVGELTRLWAEGLTGAAIAKVMGAKFTRDMVLGKARKLGLPRRREKPPTPRAPRTRARSDAINHTKAMRAIAPPPLPRETPAPSPEFQVTFLERTGKRCKWIIGEPNGPDSICCGARQKAGEVYCEFHCRIAYNPRRA